MHTCFCKYPEQSLNSNMFYYISEMVKEDMYSARMEAHEVTDCVERAGGSRRERQHHRRTKRLPRIHQRILRHEVQSFQQRHDSHCRFAVVLACYKIFHTKFKSFILNMPQKSAAIPVFFQLKTWRRNDSSTKKKLHSALSANLLKSQ